MGTSYDAAQNFVAGSSIAFIFIDFFSRRRFYDKFQYDMISCWPPAGYTGYVCDIENGSYIDGLIWCAASDTSNIL